MVDTVALRGSRAFYTQREALCARGLGKRKERKLEKSKKLKRDRDAGGLAHTAMIFETREISGVDLKVK